MPTSQREGHAPASRGLLDFRRLSLRRQCRHFWVLGVAGRASKLLKKTSLVTSKPLWQSHLLSQRLQFEGLMPKLHLNLRPSSVHPSEGCSVPGSPSFGDTLEVFNVSKVVQKHPRGQAAGLMALCTRAFLQHRLPKVRLLLWAKRTFRLPQGSHRSSQPAKKRPGL